MVRLYFLFLALPLALPVSAQEMEPRAYSRAPIGTQFVLFSYAYQTGDVLTDASLPLKDVKVKLNAGSMGYGRTFGLLGHQANVSIFSSYIKGRASGTVFEERQEVTRSGIGDLRFRFSTVFVGGKALTPGEFSSYKPKTVVGASVTVVAPTGQYDPRRLINLGSNRWSFKPDVGLSAPFGRWTMEVAGGVWLFTTNDNFFGGSRREQKPLASLQANAIYTLRRRMWLSGNATYYSGGRTVVNGVINNDRQANSRVGATFSLPVSQKQSIKFAWAKGVTSRFGGKLNTFAIAWQYSWFD
ncbi:MAG TPA: transporter [Pyrinomonadaceae bacterium]|nr:transporter [Pyrinomonadaceae bacterium]